MIYAFLLVWWIVDTLLLCRTFFDYKRHLWLAASRCVVNLICEKREQVIEFFIKPLRHEKEWKLGATGSTN